MTTALFIVDVPCECGHYIYKEHNYRWEKREIGPNHGEMRSTGDGCKVDGCACPGPEGLWPTDLE